MQDKQEIAPANDAATFEELYNGGYDDYTEPGNELFPRLLSNNNPESTTTAAKGQKQHPGTQSAGVPQWSACSPLNIKTICMQRTSSSSMSNMMMMMLARVLRVLNQQSARGQNHS
jgi:hypothetical protein